MENENLEQLNKQDEFWYSIIENYENRIRNLKEEIDASKTLIHNLEAGMHAYIAYNMVSLQRRDPNASLSALEPDLTPVYSRIPEPKPDVMQSMTDFDVDNKDISYMRYVKTLFKDERELVKNIERLKIRQEALWAFRREMDKFNEGSSTKTRRISLPESQLKDTQKRLNKDNERLKTEYKEFMELLAREREDNENILQKELALEKEKIRALEEQLKNTRRVTSSDSQGESIEECADMQWEIDSTRKHIDRVNNVNNKLQSQLEKRVETILSLQNDVKEKRIAEINQIK